MHRAGFAVARAAPARAGEPEGRAAPRRAAPIVDSPPSVATAAVAHGRSLRVFEQAISFGIGAAIRAGPRCRETSGGPGEEDGCTSSARMIASPERVEADGRASPARSTESMPANWPEARSRPARLGASRRSRRNCAIPDTQPRRAMHEIEDRRSSRRASPEVISASSAWPWRNITIRAINNIRSLATDLHCGGRRPR